DWFFGEEKSVRLGPLATIQYAFTSHPDFEEDGGAEALRIDGAGTKLTVPSGVQIRSDGMEGAGLLAAYGRDTKIAVQGAISARGDSPWPGASARAMRASCRQASGLPTSRGALPGLTSAAKRGQPGQA
ncbi:MAG: hypothetical protein II595_06035, partial [Desulfovibrio sp.]|nr:hypothetical protein [Desulfovibrio sp.]